MVADSTEYVHCSSVFIYDDNEDGGCGRRNKQKNRSKFLTSASTNVHHNEVKSDDTIKWCDKVVDKSKMDNIVANDSSEDNMIQLAKHLKAYSFS